MVKAPGVVTGRYGTIGEVFYEDSDFWPLNTTLWVSSFHGNDERFIYYLLQRVNFAAHSGKSGVPGVNRNDLHTEFVSIPSSVAEQRSIAKALQDIDRLVATLKRLIAKKQAIKQGMRQQLLTGKTRFPGFSGRWHTVKAGDISTFITKGSTPTTYGFAWASSGVPFLRSECVSERGLDMRQSMFISPAAHRMLRRSQVADGDILMTITGYVGRVVRLVGLGEANINQHIARVRIKDSRFDAGYVYHYLSQPSMREYYESITTGQAYPQISLTQVRNTKIPAIALEEQQAIAAALDDADHEIDLIHQRLAKTEYAKQGMMQQLLTGRVRLKVSEGAA